MTVFVNINCVTYSVCIKKKYIQPEKISLNLICELNRIAITTTSLSFLGKVVLYKTLDMPDLVYF